MDNESKIVYLEDLLLAQQEQIDEAITQRDEAARLFLNERKRAEKAEQERDELEMGIDSLQDLVNAYQWESNCACAAYRKMLDIATGRKEQAEKLKLELDKEKRDVDEWKESELWVSARLEEVEAQRDNLQQQRDELQVSWQADNNSLKLTHSINKKLHERTIEVKRERDELQEQNAELVAALKDLVSACQSCRGTGISYNSKDCRYCRVGRFALAKLE